MKMLRRFWVRIGIIVMILAAHGAAYDAGDRLLNGKARETEKANATKAMVPAYEKTPAPFVDTSPPPRPPSPAPARARTVRPRQDGGTREVRSTAYCLRGTTASGAPAGDGVVASTILPRGSSWRILTGPLAGKVVKVLDTGGPKATFDVWVSSCEWAIKVYGARTIKIERTG